MPLLVPDLLSSTLVLSRHDRIRSISTMMHAMSETGEAEIELTPADKARGVELSWLKDLVQTLPSEVLSGLVAHRGFHHACEGSGRPVENELAAYELAWTSGLLLCECDIAMTSDGHLVLGHDSSFKRVALRPQDDPAHHNVEDLTMRDLMSVPLRSGSRPPLLADVLPLSNVSMECSIETSIECSLGCSIDTSIECSIRYCGLQPRSATVRNWSWRSSRAMVFRT